MDAPLAPASTQTVRLPSVALSTCSEMKYHGLSRYILVFALGQGCCFLGEKGKFSQFAQQEVG
jgi:hypothetical protein